MKGPRTPNWLAGHERLPAEIADAGIREKVSSILERPFGKEKKKALVAKAILPFTKEPSNPKRIRRALTHAERFVVCRH